MIVAWIALILWPVICTVLFRRLPLPAAFCTSMLGGYLLLPSGVSTDLPLLPPLDKDTITTFTVAVLTANALREQKGAVWGPEGWVPRSPVVRVFLAMLVLGTFATVMTNGEMLIYGSNIRPGLRLYDAFSMLLGTFVLILPIFLARRVLATPESQRALLVTLAVSAAIYCLPALWEVRMSPQLHIQIYGFYPHDFLQAFRGGGFRPNVFLNHGLELAIYLAIALVAAAGLGRISSGQTRSKWLMVSGFIFVTLVLAKSLTALVLAVLMLPAVLFFRQRTQLLFAACIAGVMVTYPMLRGADLVPTDRILAQAEAINPARAASLSFRFFHEDNLLEKARQKPVFGWGGWSRNRVFDEYGTDVTVSDGSWVVHFGIGGWVRYIAIFGLLCWPVIGLLFNRREKVDQLSIILALALTVKLLDLIPNSAMPPILWIMAGSLLGRMEMKMSALTPAEAQPNNSLERKSRYARSGLSGPEKAPRPADGPGYARTFSDEDTRQAKPRARADAQKLYHRSKPPQR